MAASRRRNTALSRGPFAAIMSWKQLDVLIALSDGPATCRQVSDVLTEMRDADADQLGNPYYWSSDWGGAYGALRALERRDLVGRKNDGTWIITAGGRKALALFFDH